MGSEAKFYPIGIQTFSDIREGNYVYVDKTRVVYDLTHSGLKYVFLSRPRRFGKSLLISTLQSYFEGRKDLFDGLAISMLENDWNSFPVLRFDMSGGKNMTKDVLTRFLLRLIENEEMRHGLVGDAIDLNVRLLELIQKLYRKTNQKIVILIDEYDAPILDVIYDANQLDEIRNVMRSFYAPLKGADPYIRFCFLTGITKFSQLSIFSAMNNIRNISMDERFASICGITKEELMTDMHEDLVHFADRNKLTIEESIGRFTESYDGYHFTWPSPDIFNPYSVINAFYDGKLRDYCFESGTPTFLINLLRRANVTPLRVEAAWRQSSDFDRPTEKVGKDIIPVLYQSGYLTIKDYCEDTEQYLLDIPNKEVRIGLTECLLEEYVDNAPEIKNLAGNMYVCIRDNDLDGAFKLMHTVFGTIPYCAGCTSEGHFQQMLAFLFILIGFKVDVEVRTPKGRVDVVMQTQSMLYIIELKMDKTAEFALEQINLKNYPERFALCGLPITMVGVNFDSEIRNITDWKVME